MEVGFREEIKREEGFVSDREPGGWEPQRTLSTPRSLRFSNENKLISTLDGRRRKIRVLLTCDVFRAKQR